MRHRILTIEDQPDIRRLIRMTLEFKGHEVLEADDGEQGLRLARSESPDLILLDVMMPGINGLEVARRIGDDPKLRDVPVIMISALGQAQDVQAGLATGVHAYLVKPFSPWELLELTKRLIRPSSAEASAQPT
jgi:DNA-binding response OmpR family regulator